MNIDEIDRQLIVPDGLKQAVLEQIRKQDRARGRWPNPREAKQPAPPWPTDGRNPMLRFLLWEFRARVDAGMPATDAALMLAVHAWFEGGVENYDRGRRRGRP